MPSLPGNRKTRPASQRNEGTWIAMIFVIGIIAGLFALVSLILPDIFGLLFVLAAFGGFVALHYFTWGRWLIRRQAQMQADIDAPAVNEETVEEEESE